MFAEYSTVPREQRAHSLGVIFISAPPPLRDHEPSICASSQPMPRPALEKKYG